jgi:hypothetical protein
VPLPVTVTLAPTVVPPLVHVVGAVDCGPNTVNLIVPVGLLPPESVALIELVAMALPAPSAPGALTVLVVVFFTTVEVIPFPQVLADELLLVSPL